MKRYRRRAGLLGLLLLLGGGSISVLKPELRVAMATLLSSGAFLLLLWFYLDFPAIRAALFRRSTKYGLNMALMILLLLGIIALVEAISLNHNKRFDLTEGKRHTLSDQSQKILKNLKKEVNAIAFFKTDHVERRMAEDLLRQYADLSPKFRYEFVDPDRNPARTKRYGVTAYGTVILEAGEKEERIELLDEEKLTNAIIRAIREGKRKIYFLKGHGEADLNDPGKTGYGGLKEAIEKANYEVKELLLLREAKVPEDASVLIVAGPKKDLLASELSAIKAYLEGGGKVLFLLDPFTAPSLKPFLAQYGIVMGDDVIVDRFSRVFGGDYLMPVVSNYYPHPITKDFTLASLFPYARSVDTASTPPEGVEMQKLAETGPFPGSWAETDQALLAKGQALFEEGKDRRGPVPVGVVATLEKKGKAKEEEARKARIVVYGNSTFARNDFLGFSGNRDLFLNTLSWLAEEEELISIRPKEAKVTPLFLTAAQGRLLFYIPVAGLPSLILATGAIVLLKRKRAR